MADLPPGEMASNSRTSRSRRSSAQRSRVLGRRCRTTTRSNLFRRSKPSCAVPRSIGSIRRFAFTLSFRYQALYEMSSDVTSAPARASGWISPRPTPDIDTGNLPPGTYLIQRREISSITSVSSSGQAPLQVVGARSLLDRPEAAHGVGSFSTISSSRSVFTFMSGCILILWLFLPAKTAPAVVFI